MPPLDPPRDRPGPRRRDDDWRDLDELPVGLGDDATLIEPVERPVPADAPVEPTVGVAAPVEARAVAGPGRPSPRPRRAGPPTAATRPSSTGPSSPRRRGGLQPAGAVLVTMVVGLALAALVNADALVARAERKPLGSGRDRSLMIWHPVQDLSHVLQLYRIRDLGDSLAGNQARGSADAFAEAAHPTATTEPVSAVPVLRSPTAEAPLRVYLAGDSIIHDGGLAFIDQMAGDPLIDPHLHYENATGLARPDFYDWPKTLRDDAATYDPEVVVLMFGGNDAQGIVGPDGAVFQDLSEPGWQAEYARRVGFVMDELRAPDRVLLWMGLPPMRSTTFDPKARIMSSIFREQASTRPWVRYIDLTKEFGDSQGRYVQTKPGDDGAPVDLRKSDGIHFNVNGADRFARYLRDEIDAALADLSEPATTTTNGS